MATVQGKAYFLIVDELKRRGIPFISRIPGEPIPAEIRVVITTATEKPRVTHEKILVFNPESDPEILATQVVRALQGKETYEFMIIGVDPGEVFGVAVLADGALVDSDNCFSVKEVVNRLKRILKAANSASGEVSVKIGNGVPVYRELLEALDKALPLWVTLEVVSEAGTNHHEHRTAHGRNMRHIVSATHIAGRAGHVYPRGQIIEELH